MAFSGPAIHSVVFALWAVSALNASDSPVIFGSDQGFFHGDP